MLSEYFGHAKIEVFGFMKDNIILMYIILWSNLIIVDYNIL